jgi:leucyl/phenylalanyl-tRNA--protein transferase
MVLPFTPEVVEQAYRHGVFPMAVDGDIYWYQPDPRTIIPLDGFHISKSLRRTINRQVYEVVFDRDFIQTMEACADRLEGSWINNEFYEVYGALHQRGKAHSVEAWQEGRLVGGAYGVSLGGAFMAESMFHTATDAGKVALAALIQRMNERGFTLLDVQYLTPHLATLGAIEIPHREYMRRLARALTIDAALI